VDPDEAELACYYEYARESKVLWKAAEKRNRLMRRGKWSYQQAVIALLDKKTAENLGIAAKWNCEQAVIALTERTPTPWPCGYLGMEFLMCRSFPVKDWNELSQVEREAFIRFERRRIPPLPTTHVWSLKTSGVFDAFKTMGEKAKPVIRNVRPGETPGPMKTVPPVLQWTESIYRVIFDVDFSKTKEQLLNEFSVWLDLPENRKLLKRHKKAKIGMTGKSLDRLKDLATWRLYRELDNDWAAANDFATRHRKEHRPFHDARHGQSKRVQRTQADLGSEESYFLKAKKRALNYLAEYIPDEFSVSLPSCLDDYDKLFIEEFRKTTDRPGKISKKPS
jgi:hypothetical protein